MLSRGCTKELVFLAIMCLVAATVYFLRYLDCLFLVQGRYHPWNNAMSPWESTRLGRREIYMSTKCPSSSTKRLSWISFFKLEKRIIRSLFDITPTEYTKSGRGMPRNLYRSIYCGLSEGVCDAIGLAYYPYPLPLALRKQWDPSGHT